MVDTTSPSTFTLPRAIFVAAALICTLFARNVQAADAPRGKLYFFGVAVDSSPPKGQSLDHYNYAPDNLSRIFTAQSSDLFQEVRSITLKGNQVTRVAVLQQLERLQKALTARDVLFIYWGTHGESDELGWSASIAGNQTIRGGEIKSILGRMPCPAIIMVSTCGSGGFARPGAKDVPLPDNVTAFCACRKKRTTNNELDVAFCEALTGFADLDQNGAVTLREALDYVPRRYRSWSTPNDLDQKDILPVIGLKDGAPLDLVLTQATKERAIVAHENGWYGAAVLARPDGRLKVRYLGWDPSNPKGTYAKPDEVVPLDRVCDLGGTAPIEVEWNGTWWPARVVKQTPQGTHIHYVGWADSYDETVGPERIRKAYFGTAKPATPPPPMKLNAPFRGGK